MSKQIFEKFLIAQRSAYGRSLPDKVGQIAAQWHLVASGSVGRASLAELEHLAPSDFPLVAIDRRNDAGGLVPYVGGDHVSATAYILEQARALRHRHPLP